MRRGVVEVLRAQNRAFGGDAATAHNLDRLRDGAVAVVTGQQVGLFGGPAYSVYKALTAIHVGPGINRRGDKRRPGFLACHRGPRSCGSGSCFFSEARRRRAVRPRHARALPTGASARFVSARRFAKLPLRAVRTARADRWPRKSRAGSPRVIAPEETFGSSFAKLMTRMFAGRGLIFLDPMSAELHRLVRADDACAPSEGAQNVGAGACRAIGGARAGGLSRASESRRAEHAGLSHRRWAASRASSSQRRIRRPGARQESVEETLRAVELHPEEFSPSALLRPVIQDTLLPTVAYIGGPAEVAYHAQTSVVYQRASRPGARAFCRARVSRWCPRTSQIC